MHFIKIITCLLLLNLLALNLSAQDKPIEDACPVLTVTEPSGVVAPGEDLIFTANVTGGSSDITYNWRVDKGTITEGQGTAAITVSTEGLLDDAVTVTVSITGGFLNTCDTEESGTGIVRSKPQARLFETVENPNCDYHMMILDGFFRELQNDPSATGYILTYGSPRSVSRMERQMRSYLNMRKFDPTRVVFISGGLKGNLTVEHWIVPAGADSPTVKGDDLPEKDTADTPKESASDTGTETDAIDKTKPYIFSSEFYDGYTCYGEENEIDLEGYAQILKENPKSRGNIVISLMTKQEFREKEKEILDFLTSKGINRKRLRTFHQKSFGGVELWFLP